MTTPTDAASIPVPVVCRGVPCDESYDSRRFNVNNNRIESSTIANTAQIGEIWLDSFTRPIHACAVLPSDYARKLVALRRARGLNHKQAAEALQMREQTLRQNEDGTRRPYERNRVKYGEFYGVDPDTLEPFLTIQGEPLPTQGQPATVQPSNQSEDATAATGDGEAASGEHYVKEMLFRIYKRLGPEKGDQWLNWGYNEANRLEAQSPGKTPAGGSK